MESRVSPLLRPYLSLFLLLPHEEKVDAAELAEMIQHINGEEVPREDWLSDHAYFYNHEDDSLIAV